MPQKASESLLTSDFVWRRRICGWIYERDGSDRPVADTLMRAMGVVVMFVLADEKFEVPFSEYNEMVQNLEFDAFNEPFGKSV